MTRSQQWAVIALLCLGFGTVIGFLVTKVIEERPERVWAQSFLLSNSVVQERFGMPITVRYLREGTRIIYHGDGIEGVYRFMVEGESGTGTLRVIWSSEGTTRDFEIEAVHLLRNGQIPELLWTND